jgi:uncharacterized protein (DUF342 family)
MPAHIPGLEWKVSPDRLSMMIRLKEDFDGEITAGQVLSIFLAEKISVPPNEEAISNCLASRSSEWVIVAEGTPPVPPTPGRLEYFIDPFHLEQRSAVSKDERVDYKHLNLILNVKKDQQLIRKHDPIPGSPGMDVYGKPVPPPDPRPISIPVAEGIKIVENGCLAIAAEDGAITTRRNGIALSKKYSIVGDVSYKTGSVEFNGTIEVGKSVLSGFELKAEGDIVVTGVVEGARLEAGGSITILGGIQGGGKAFLKAGGNIAARFAGEATLEAEGDVRIQTQIVNCEISARGQVVLVAPQGTAVGGEIRAGQGISVPFLGAQAGTKTLAQIGLDSDLPRKIQHTEEVIEEATTKAADVDTLLGRLAEVRQHRGALPPPQEEARVLAVKEKFNLKGQIDSLTKDLDRMREELALARQGTVEVTDTVHPGVTIRIGGDVYRITHTLRYTTFYYEKGEIHTRAG